MRVCRIVSPPFVATSWRAFAFSIAVIAAVAAAFAFVWTDSAFITEPYVLNAAAPDTARGRIRSIFSAHASKAFVSGGSAVFASFPVISEIFSNILTTVSPAFLSPPLFSDFVMSSMASSTGSDNSFGSIFASPPARELAMSTPEL